ncbi:MAG TPA: phosphoethanolamine transferase domain-containing protein, partial [Cellvibrio sp.]|nr:phosphoethanolamine transferase domain-containing protein [Cellvibrio sp.]
MALFSSKFSTMTLDNKANNQFWSWQMSPTKFTLVCSVFFVIFYNTAFFKTLHTALPIDNVKSALFFISVSLLVSTVTALVLSFFVLPKISKPAMMFVFFAAASVSYFMNAYGIVIHQTMIQNTIETDTNEARGLLNGTLAIYILVLGVTPSLLLLKVKLSFGDLKHEVWSKLKLWGGILLMIFLLIAPFTADYASFFRNHKNIRQMANPVNFIYATIAYASASNKSITVKPIGEDAKLNEHAKAQTKPILFVLVVGETA